jgi:hypothetical protein
VVPDYPTSGMIALLPADPDAFTVPGGDPADEMHLTLAYLGDDLDTWSEVERAAVHRAVTDLIGDNSDPLTGRVFGHAVFNPGEGSATVHLVGEADAIDRFRDELWGWLRRGLSGRELPEQHAPFAPHITAGYGVPFGRLKHTGPVRFDRVRVAMAGTTTDYPITGTRPEEPAVEQESKTAGDYTWADAPDPFTAGVLLGLSGLDDDEAAETKAGPPGATYPSKDPGATRLRQYWVRGPGAAKIRWGTGGDFDRCVRHLRKHVGTRAEGLCNIFHRSALGAAPGKGHKGLEGQVETKSLELWVADPDSPVGWRARTFTWERVTDPTLAAELKSAADIERAQADAARRAVESKAATKAPAPEPEVVATAEPADPEAALDRFEEMADTLTAEEAYEEALSADLDWEMTGDGELVEQDAAAADGSRPPKLTRGDDGETEIVEVEVEDETPDPVEGDVLFGDEDSLFGDEEPGTDGEEPPPMVSLFDVEEDDEPMTLSQAKR